MDGVTLASMHASKGLEWDAVFLPGLAEGVMPIVYARTPEAIEEERRLLYVAITRARERLYLSWPAARGPGARAAGQPSRYLAELIPGSRPASVLARGATPRNPPNALRAPRWYFADTPAAHRAQGPVRWAGHERLAVTRGGARR
ncbi:MAG: 3'-5' exonuclease, partial [Streptosporangiaceae bacterium]